LYTNSLAMQIPCPLYKLAQISSPAQTLEITQTDESISNQTNTQADDLSIQDEELSNTNSSGTPQKSEIEIPTS
ncbi:MAG: hypothetical protein ACREAE_08715, partial [Nitrosopumilaceae archaeon]